MIRYMVIALVAISSVASAQTPEGWEALSGSWVTSNGVSTGQADGNDAWLQIATATNDFTLDLEFQSEANNPGAIQIRSHWLPDESAPESNVFYGYRYTLNAQAKDGTGSIIDQHGRGPLVIASPDALKVVKAEDWNHVRIEARDTVMSLWINGVKANHFNDEAFIGGSIALGALSVDGATTKVAYRKISLEFHERAGTWRPLFDGTSLDGWKVYGSERFDVEDGVIVGRSGPKKSEGYLLTDESLTDFHVRGSFKMLGAGNFGMFYRSKIALRAEDGYPLISGVQGEVDPAYPGPSGWHYESYRRGWIHEEPQKASMRAYAATPETWGEIEIRAIGNRTTSWINGIRIVDFYDPNPQVFEGGFALQLHAGGVEGIMWKDIFVQD